MKVLTATNETQGRRDKDFCWTVEGELVFFPPIECDCYNFDDSCGCERSWAGVASQRATTTIKVTDREELDPHTYATLISQGLRDQGYLPDEVMADPETNRWLRETTDELMNIAGAFPAGTVLERHRGSLRVRVRPMAQA